MALRLHNLRYALRVICQVRPMSSDSQQPGWGAGAGRGGGSGGSVRDAGGAFGKMEAAHEEQYFRKLQAEQLKVLRESIHDEIHYHEKEIQEHQESIERHKQKMETLKSVDK